jgi:hypothetical protein
MKARDDIIPHPAAQLDLQVQIRDAFFAAK